MEKKNSRTQNWNLHTRHIYIHRFFFLSYTFIQFLAPFIQCYWDFIQSAIKNSLIWDLSTILSSTLFKSFLKLWKCDEKKCKGNHLMYWSNMVCDFGFNNWRLLSWLKYDLTIVWGCVWQRAFLRRRLEYWIHACKYIQDFGC